MRETSTLHVIAKTFLMEIMVVPEVSNYHTTHRQHHTMCLTLSLIFCIYIWEPSLHVARSVKYICIVYMTLYLSAAVELGRDDASKAS